MQQSRLFPTQGRAFRLFLLGGLSIILIACAWPVGQPTLTPTISTSTETSSPTTTQTNTRIFPTTTPFPPTATFSPVVTSTRIPFSTRTPTQILPGVRFPETPVPIIRPPSYPAGQVRILLLGADFRGGDTYRTDSILLLSLNPQNGTASLLSLPPALYVNIPEIGMERLNSAITFGGAGKVMDTIQYNLGIRPDKFFFD